MRITAIIVAVGLIAAFGYWAFLGNRSPEVQVATTTVTGGPLVDIIVPLKFTANAQIGEQVYTSVCADCHGSNAAGQDGCPPRWCIYYLRAVPPRRRSLSTGRNKRCASPSLAIREHARCEWSDPWRCRHGRRVYPKHQERPYPPRQTGNSR